MFNFKDFIKLFKNYKFNFLLKIKEEKKIKNKLTFIFSFFKNKNIINNNIIKNINYNIIFFIIIIIIIFIFLFFYLYSVDIMLYLYPDKIINYLNISIDKEAAGFTFLGAFLPFSHYFISLRNLYVGVFLDYKKKVYNRTILLLQFVHKGGLRPLTVSKKRKKSLYMKIFLTKYSVLDKEQIYTHYASGFPKNGSMNGKLFTKALNRPDNFWNIYFFVTMNKYKRERAFPMFDSVNDNSFNKRLSCSLVDRHENGQILEFYAQDRLYYKKARYVIRGPKSYFNVRPDDINFYIRILQKKNNFFLASRANGNSEDYLFFKNFFFKYKYRLENAFYKKTLNKLGEFYIYYLDLTSDKILFNIYIFFEYIWSFFLIK